MAIHFWRRSIWRWLVHCLRLDRVSNDADSKREIIGGKFLVYAPDNQQGFPSSFGADGLLFTADDPTVGLPQGYTVVDLDTEPFTFDRSREIEIDLIEPKSGAGRLFPH